MPQCECGGYYRLLVKLAPSVSLRLGHRAMPPRSPPSHGHVSRHLEIALWMPPSPCPYRRDISFEARCSAPTDGRRRPLCRSAVIMPRAIETTAAGLSAPRPTPMLSPPAGIPSRGTPAVALRV